MQCRKEAVPVFTPSSSAAIRSRTVAGSTTNRKKQQRVVVLIVLPKNVIAGLHPSRRTLDLTNVPEAPTLPMSCARKPWDACCFSQPKDDRTTRRGPYISQEPGGGKGAGGAVEVLQHLRNLFSLKRKW
jgi:hypothetical protein